MIQGDTALRVHPAHGVNINSPNERGAVSDSPFQVDNEYFITSLSLKKEENPFLLASSVL